MVSENLARIRVRDAAAADVPGLTAIKGAGTEAIHRDRLRDARRSDLRYLVLLLDQDLIGFACLVFRRPTYWSDADDTGRLPRIVDLQVKASQRSRGYGSDFVRAIERTAAAAGHKQLYLSVEPLANPRALAFYQRLGYQPLQLEPYRSHWAFTDSEGKVHQGQTWALDMVKSL